MVLKLKSFIYRLTGIYLANKEELEYVTSKEFWRAFKKIKDKTLSNQVKQGILIGLWQCEHKFYRRARF